MTKLYWVGPTFSPGSAIPLFEGWPAADHDEPDKALAKEKTDFKLDGKVVYSLTDPNAKKAESPAT